MNAETVLEWVKKAEGDYENAHILARQRKKVPSQSQSLLSCRAIPWHIGNGA